jgi:hypothetical protein
MDDLVEHLGRNGGRINLIDQQTAVAIRENDREEENASFDLGSKVSRHGVSFHDMVGTARRAPLSYCVTHVVVCVLKLCFRNRDIVAEF